jgi:hypothetical protein
MNNLTAERVLFAFAEGGGEDYPFRLNNPVPAASGKRFASVDGTVAPAAFCRRDNRALIDSQHRRVPCADCGAALVGNHDIANVMAEARLHA